MPRELWITMVVAAAALGGPLGSGCRSRVPAGGPELLAVEPRGITLGTRAGIEQGTPRCRLWLGEQVMDFAPDWPAGTAYLITRTKDGNRTWRWQFESGHVHLLDADDAIRVAPRGDTVAFLIREGKKCRIELCMITAAGVCETKKQVKEIDCASSLTIGSDSLYYSTAGEIFATDTSGHARKIRGGYNVVINPTGKQLAFTSEKNVTIADTMAEPIRSLPIEVNELGLPVVGFSSSGAVSITTYSSRVRGGCLSFPCPRVDVLHDLSATSTPAPLIDSNQAFIAYEFPAGHPCPSARPSSER